MVKGLINAKKNIESALSIKSGDHRKKPLSEDPNLPTIGILRFFTMLKKTF
jgi:hypothetical protein